MATNWNAILSNTNNLQDVLSILKKVLAQLDIKADITTVDEALLTISQLDQDVTEKLLAVSQALAIFEAHKDEVLDNFESEANALIQNIENQGNAASQDLKEAIDIALAAGAGAAGWTDLLVQTWSGRTQNSKNKEIISALDFGAVGDGQLHTVQEWIDVGLFTGLSNIQASYPHVTSLSDSVDWAATIKGINYLLQRGGGSLNFPHVGERYVFNKDVEIPQYSKNIRLASDGASLFFSAGSRIFASDPDSVAITGFDEIEFSAETSNGIAFGRPKHCTVDVNKVKGASNFLVIFFATDDLVEQCPGNFIRVKYADGMNRAAGGLGMAAMKAGRIEGTVTRVTQGIGYGVNFKNNCIACTCDVITIENKTGLVISNDTGAGTGTGVNSSTFNVTSIRDTMGHSMHRGQRNTVNINYTGNALDTDVAVYVAAYCADNTYNIKAYNGGANAILFYTRSDKQDFNIVDTDYTFGKLGYFDADTDSCNVILNHKYSYSGNGRNIDDLFYVHPTCRQITLQNLADAPNVIHNYDTVTATESWQQGRVFFPQVGETRASNYISMSNGNWYVRVKNVDIFSYNSINKSFDVVNDDVSMGREGRFLTGVFTRKVMLTNTLGVFSTTSSPEGNTAASVGSLCLRNVDNSSSTAFSLFVKESGSGNTGWKPVATYLSNSLAVASTSIAAQSYVDFQISVIGVTPSRSVLANVTNINGLIYSAFISSNDVVTVRLFNPSFSAINYAGTIYVKAI
ncbi:hypothetical protein [uncultured Acinetobacter sp.]|uniref:hypothetical protein n=1 Tax=uncultured Acinetobacter sp. TaxID=165433 RepID=UPI00258279C0|nr:hypothetical protein [uncultured Acinetobacter sp.]